METHTGRMIQNITTTAIAAITGTDKVAANQGV
jgi:hypothetical protein